MDPLSRFVEYVQDFEKTYVDDDWSRLTKYFAPDATYTVKGAGADCHIVGRDAILRGIKKSVSGFDKKFVEREVDFSGAPTVEGSTVRAPWAVTYRKTGAPDFILRGCSTAVYRDGVIATLSDDMVVDDAGMAWLGKYGEGLDPKYV